MLEIPINPELPKQRVTVTLGGAVLTLSFRWNTVTESWYMSAEDVEGNVLVEGVRMVVLRVPLSTPSYIWKPHFGLFGDGGGGLLLLGLGGAVTTDPGRHDLGSSHRLVYITDEELSRVVAEDSSG